MAILNLTPHPITLIGAGDDGTDLVLQPRTETLCGSDPYINGDCDHHHVPGGGCFDPIVQVAPARVTAQAVQIGTFAGIPVRRTSFGDVTGVPDAQPDTVLIVSRLVADALAASGRIDDILIVDDTVRDADGKIIGARALATVSAVDPACLDAEPVIV